MIHVNQNMFVYLQYHKCSILYFMHGCEFAQAKISYFIDHPTYVSQIEVC